MLIEYMRIIYALQYLYGASYISTQNRYYAIEGGETVQGFRATHQGFWAVE